MLCCSTADGRRPGRADTEALRSQGDIAARPVAEGTQVPRPEQLTDEAAGPSASAVEQPAQRASSATAAAAAAKQVKRLHSPTEDAAQKLQRLGSGGAAAAPGTVHSAGVPPGEPPRVPARPRTQGVAVGGRSDGLPAPTVNGIPASLAGNGFETAFEHHL